MVLVESIGRRSKLAARLLSTIDEHEINAAAAPPPIGDGILVKAHHGFSVGCLKGDRNAAGATRALMHFRLP